MKKYPYIVAEIGGNHNGDIELGKQMIKAAKECGADAVKFQLNMLLLLNCEFIYLFEYVVKPQFR